MTPEKRGSRAKSRFGSSQNPFWLEPRPGGALGAHYVFDWTQYRAVYSKGAVAMLSLLASIYLLFRRGNAIAPEITPSVRLRRWTAAFFA